MHRARTAEQRTLDLDAVTESFCFNLERLWRATPGGMSAFRRRTRRWVSKNVRIIPGHPPSEVQAWRKSVEPLLFPHLSHGRSPTYAEAYRLFLWQTLLNGDGRQRDRVEHYEIGCCRDKADTLGKLMGPYGLKACLSNLPRCSRKRWQGQEDDVAKIAFLEMNHGMISNNWVPEDVAAEAQARRYLRQQAANAHQEAAPQGGQDDDREAVPNQEEHQEVARRVQGFLQTIDARDRIMRFALCTQPFSQMKAAI